MTRDSLKAALASALGLGLSPFASGTCGTLLGVLLHLLIVLLVPEPLRLYALLLAFSLTVLLALYLAPWAINYWQSDDPGSFVLDEVAGYLLVFLLYRPAHPWPAALWGFLLFRFFDIVKIPPARQCERHLPGAWGIILDDLVAAVQAALALYLFHWLT